MILLTLSEIVKHYGPEPVLGGVSLDLRPGERASLVGPNGAGKTTLLRIVAGQLDADRGTCELHPSCRLGYLEQQPDFAVGRTVWDEAKSALDELLGLTHEAEELGHAIAAASDGADRKRLEHRFERVQYQLSHHNVYNLDYKIERVLGGLGFAKSSYQQPLETLSGGQQNRILLAKLLLAEPDLMLLDEPSNHLDIDATEWLEKHLVETDQAILVVSHDRYFLDKVTNRTLELYQGTIESYPGNFTQYKRLKAERLEVQRRTYEKQQEEIARMEDFVRKYQFGERHSQAEDRRKKLARIERVLPPREIAAPPMGFPPASRTGDIVLRVTRLAKGFPQSVVGTLRVPSDGDGTGSVPTEGDGTRSVPTTYLQLFNNLSFDVLRGEKWGILGPNGCGKTTLLRCLLGEIDADEGTITLGSGVKIGYFDQLLSGLDLDAVAMDAIRPGHKEFVDQERRNLLARFGIIGDMATQKVGSLSGGERNRVALARLAALDANVLLLDEPTNHLDLWARGALEQALKDFDGSVIFVSHDRYFLNQVATKLLVVEPGRFRTIDGNYETYLHFIKQGLAADARAAVAATSASGGATSASGGATSASGGRQPPAARAHGSGLSGGSRTPLANDKPRRKRKYPYRKLPEIEAEIATREHRISEIHGLFADESIFRDGQRVKDLKSELAEHEATLARLYEHWEEASELN
ncbi:MAG TPA: ABC-F family ATP-binding cassette domain-containing protein [Pirellulaceae bacterium]|nr:ABC-F family ATP-binding cassette domain-containing protein [Pirellulaceae bacterium]